MVDMQQPPVAGETDEAWPAMARIAAREPGMLELRDHPACETAVVPITMASADLPTAVGEAIGEVEREIARAGVEAAGPPFTRYFSFGARITAETGVPVLRHAPDIGRVRPGLLPGGRVASMVHVGPYEALPATYARLMREIGDRGLRPQGPMWEVYWSDPGAEPDPAAWRTELIVPVG